MYSFVLTAALPCDDVDTLNEVCAAEQCSQCGPHAALGNRKGVLNSQEILRQQCLHARVYYEYRRRCSLILTNASAGSLPPGF